MKKMVLTQLPRRIEVHVKRGQSGVYIAELPELNIFTECDSLEDIDPHVNDLIFTHFDIPKRLQNKIWYRPEKTVTPRINQSDPYHFTALTSPETFNYFFQ
ncbi:MAG: hypothetical protein UX99_C0011G0005 [Candidatus Amesbacteria bacterium GW2011_GWB1_47_26]|uniref:Uncharacterized protein n=1 Tax=Candidatus Amesbacteria bacterium GW2011_GWC2_45_19 TaxID=1618366 RepID=A0A0G1P8X0_9BACT|nr:MAG: hypothetical protein UX05_C0016G0004 [Candidatus Amesbacteria bacterium GW2011_GWC2_45_19]KKU37970.1 MAG: hypothetical protein UX52_C0013G0004 [Candidatus Amesbacteria bacterium GW2011_GWA1_46_35]KKU68587.1 MAG: hypothetical protein UX93_C0006G0004 [Microgenomates group bacterium GW2011_GWC1_47_20]KKU74549.1 MAG: hypothetical protein UX99_C0011G0005 [Candidatus Amesbacteria bacterium GW2011_GWB1_47_26]